MPNATKPPNERDPDRQFGEKSKSKDDERARQKRERDKAAGEQIAAAVLEREGRPYRFSHSQGNFLWRDDNTNVSRYRVNVFVYHDGDESITGSTRISDSYFVWCDETGILSMKKG